MKNFLFPHRFQTVGWTLFAPAMTAGILYLCNVLSPDGFWATVMADAIVIGMALGALFIVCSKERTEDEMTQALRLSSLMWALYIYVGILIVSTLLINGLLYLYFMVCNLGLLPLTYVCVFRLSMRRYYKLAEDEEQN